MNKKLISNIFLQKISDNITNIEEIIGKGFVNRTFLVETTNSKYIFRISDEVSSNEYIKEKWCMEQARKIKIPTSNVLTLGKYKAYNYMIEDYIDGINGTESDCENEIWFYLGKYAKKLHDLEIFGFGFELENYDKGVFLNTFSKNLDEQIKYNKSHLGNTDELFLMNVYQEKDIPFIENIFDFIVKQNYKIGLNHGDLSRKNTIIDKNKKVSLIDYGCAIAHIVPFYDFTYIFGETLKNREPNENMLKNFGEGYGLSSKELNNMKKDVFAVMLLVYFDKVRCCISNNDKDIDYYASFANKVLLNTKVYFN